MKMCPKFTTYFEVTRRKLLHEVKSEWKEYCAGNGEARIHLATINVWDFTEDLGECYMVYLPEMGLKRFNLNIKGKRNPTDP